MEIIELGSIFEVHRSRFRTVVFLTALGNRHGEFHQRFFVLAIADSRPANKGSTTELLWVNSPPPEPISVYDYHRGISAGGVARKQRLVMLCLWISRKSDRDASLDPQYFFTGMVPPDDFNGGRGEAPCFGQESNETFVGFSLDRGGRYFHLDPVSIGADDLVS